MLLVESVGQDSGGPRGASCFLGGVGGLPLGAPSSALLGGLSPLPLPRSGLSRSTPPTVSPGGGVGCPGTPVGMRMHHPPYTAPHCPGQTAAGPHCTEAGHARAWLSRCRSGLAAAPVPAVPAGSPREVPGPTSLGSTGHHCPSQSPPKIHSWLRAREVGIGSGGLSLAGV